MTFHELAFFLGFLLLVVFMLSMDIGVFHKKDHVVPFKEATIWTCVWVAVALCFYLFIYFFADLIHGPETIDDLISLNTRFNHRLRLEGLSFEQALPLYRHTLSLEYLTGYLMEKSLSVDNIFVMILIFKAFAIEKKYYRRVLFYGIFGAIIFRFIFIFTASALIQRFDWMLLLFGAVLIFAGIKMFVERNKEDEMDVKNHPVVKFLAKRNLSTPDFRGHSFFVKGASGILCTPLFLAFLVIEFSDIIFAFDSVPAVFSVSKDPFVVFCSNIFAILGLRSLFFMMERVINRFHLLKIGLSVLLVFIGVKMLLPALFHIEISTGVSLSAIVGIIAASIIASLIFTKGTPVDEG
ncbi:MAG: TerC/Alx family metal homeostasis membrane protein [Leptospirales bacterium]|nr:TerC/Alx family metal homeostasis membrane protein [Leptospirales bacterium]